MNNIKECFVEPKDRNSLSKIVDEYRSRVKNSSPTGACFMAVCRGKVSEGIDFADRDARAVVITGIPFPSLYDPKVKLKRKFLDTKKIERKGISGSDWYNLEAFRALNQAIGRVIRHKDDFGAVLLLDKRFGYEANAKKLPSWLEKSITETNFRKGMARLAQFYHLNKHNMKLKPAVLTKALPTEKKASLSSKIESKTVLQPPNKRKKIVIKPRGSIFEENVNNQLEQTNTPIDSENSGASNITPNTDIQQFVLLLKSKLQKIHLRQLIGEIKVYKENGMIKPLLDMLKELLLKESITKEDINRFRPFVRKNDEEAFDNVL